MADIFDIELFISGLRLSVPLILAAMGGMFSERGGVVNIALDGIMIFGAFTAATVAYQLNNPWFGALAAVIVGGLIAHIHGVASIRYSADQIVSGTAINLLALGIPAVIANYLFQSTSVTPNISLPLPDITFDFLTGIPLLGALFNGHSIMIYITVLVCFMTYLVIFRMPFGLRLRAVGENPEVADTAGINVHMIRYYGVWMSGMLAGLSGAYLSVAHGTAYVRNISAGRGYIALAALIFGRYKPKLTICGCLIFGVADALQIRMQSVVDIPVQFIQIIPFVLTMLILAGFIGKAYVPAALSKPYAKES